MTAPLPRLANRSFQTSCLQTLVEGTASDSTKIKRKFGALGLVVYLFYLLHCIYKIWQSPLFANAGIEGKLGAVGFMAVIFLFTLLTLLSRFLGRSNLLIDSSGVSSWGSLGAISGLKRLHRWKDLQCVRFEKNVVAVDSAELLIFDWDTAGKRGLSHIAEMTIVDLSILNPQERLQLFSSMALYVPQELIAPEALYLQIRALSGDYSGSLDNFTELWINEFSSRFSLANYVPLQPGSVLGHYVVNMLTASRSNSSIYLAEDAAGRRLVLKELTVPVDCDDKERLKILEQFNREAAILARLNHPAIVRIVDHFVAEGRSYIVMDLVDGFNLRELVRTGGVLAEATVISIGCRAAAVLAYLHAQTPPLLHRDFTPDNLILDAAGNLTVIDFGAANIFSTGKTATLIGKQNYMPPEQLRGKASPASDIYSLGATLAFLLTGKDLPAMGRLPSLDSVAVSADLVSVLQSCLALEPEERPTASELENIFAGRRLVKGAHDAS